MTYRSRVGSDPKEAGRSGGRTLQLSAWLSPVPAAGRWCDRFGSSSNKRLTFKNKSEHNHCNRAYYCRQVFENPAATPRLFQTSLILMTEH
eukprot:2525803-Pleurochrysis_carterae.AAC.2